MKLIKKSLWQAGYDVPAAFGRLRVETDAAYNPHVKQAASCLRAAAC